jgi:hypothetical protein
MLILNNYFIDIPNKNHTEERRKLCPSPDVTGMIK